jgi:hypothetical protein
MLWLTRAASGHEYSGGLVAMPTSQIHAALISKVVLIERDKVPSFVVNGYVDDCWTRRMESADLNLWSAENGDWTDSTSHLGAGRVEGPSQTGKKKDIMRPKLFFSQYSEQLGTALQ